MSFYVLRYQPEVDFNLRKHSETIGRFDSFEDAEQVRSTRENGHLLRTEGPREERAA